LFRIKAAINNEIEKPEHIRSIRQCFAVGDQITYIDEKSNSLVSAVVIDKMVKNVFQLPTIFDIETLLINMDQEHRDIENKESFEIT
jgi:hypothetical protein